jgi:outer membrane immunogenic protein
VFGDTFANPVISDVGGNDLLPVPLSSGGFAGGQLGCDYQTGPIVWGLEGEAAWSRIINRFDLSVPSSRESSANLVWSADGAVRAGVTMDRGLLYGKVGMAAARFQFSATEEILGFPFFEHGSATLPGLLLGAGIEYALTPNWSVLIEYDRIAYAGRVGQLDTSSVISINPQDHVSATLNEAKAGINYRFGSGAALPPAASASQRLLPPPTTDWTGCYAGVHVGGGVIDDTFVSPDGLNAVGGGELAGGQVGCNYQTGIMVFGLEGDAAWSNMANRLGFMDLDVSSNRNRWNADIAARAGIATERALLSGKAGFAAGRFDFFAVDNVGDFLQGGATLTGLLLGLGVEYAFAPNWSVKLEYDHVGYLSRTVDLATLNTSESVTTNTVKAGINYKFFGSSGVVVARD